MTTFVGVHSNFYAYHRWLDAPNKVKFLREYHPHQFKAEVTIEVTHNERQIEFYILKEQLDKALIKYINKKHEKSCETFAKEIRNYFIKLYPDSEIFVTVEEDQGYYAMDLGD